MNPPRQSRVSPPGEEHVRERDHAHPEDERVADREDLLGARPDVLHVEADRAQQQDPAAGMRVVRVGRDLQSGLRIELRPLDPVLMEVPGRTHVGDPGVPAPPEVMEPGDPRDHVDRDRREQQREHDPERLARDRPAERAQPRAVAAMPPGGLPHVGEHDDREQREGARPFHGRGGAERGSGGEAPRPPDRRGPRAAAAAWGRRGSTAAVDLDRPGSGGGSGSSGSTTGRGVLGHGLSSFDPAPVEQEQHERQHDPHLEVDVEQADARHHHVQVLDRHQQAGDRGPQRPSRTAAAPRPP